MRGFTKLAFLAAFLGAHSQSDAILTIEGTVLPPAGDNGVPTGSQYSYLTYASTVRVTGTAAAAPSATMSSNGTASSMASSTGEPESYINLAGTLATSALNGSASATSTGAQPVNTQPCNNYPEFCNRQYSNITQVAAHNSPFSIPNNAASNQQLDVTTQLNDGIRMLQGQVHYENETLYFCHTSCSLLNAGTVEAYLTKVAAWVRTHPYDVITIVFGNSDVVSPQKFVDPIQNAGLGPYLYEPSSIPMGLNDWPTLGQMILNQDRVVVFMDYGAKQEEVPYIMDEFSQMWETPFSPTDVNFPCVVERPPDLSEEDASNRLYIANHNLNTQVAVAGLDFLIPNTAELNVTNGVEGTGSLGLAVENCENMWNRPPNFLLVDYYNIGSFNGSVLQIAATANGVAYRGGCCGSMGSTAMHAFKLSFTFLTVAAVSSILFMST